MNDFSPIIPPHNTKLEFSVIGALLQQNDLLGLLGFINSEDFYDPLNADIFQAMRKLHGLGEGITPFTILKHLTNPTAFDTPGLELTRYLASALTSNATVFNIVADAKHLKQLSQRRQIISFCSCTITDLMEINDPKTAGDHASALVKHIDSVSDTSLQRMFSDNYEVGEEILQAMKNEEKPTSTGIPKLDIALGGGFFRKKMYGFVARKKVGKTAMGATLSYNLNMTGHKHLFICGEMSASEVYQRQLARHVDAHTSSFVTDHGKTLAFMQKIAGAVCEIPRNTIYHTAPGIAFADLRRVCQEAVERRGIEGFILDYWQLVRGKQKGQSTSEHLDEVAQWIATFSREHDIWSVSFGQLNQDGNTRGSEGIRLACDQLLEIHRDDVTRPETWIEMLETRHTAWMNIGSKKEPGLEMNERGVFFQQIFDGEPDLNWRERIHLQNEF